MARVLFVSDLHLTGDRPAASARFFRFLSREAAGAHALYVLGDLFEYWIGDDELESPVGDGLAREVCAALAATSRNGTAVYVMHGNRDFLIGPRFCLAAGATLLDDPAALDVEGRRTLLMHGDTLCIDDHDYIAWRRTARSETWQREFLSKPPQERHRLVSALREKSRQQTQIKSPESMDANAHAVSAALREHGARRLIHGHTHRPALHELDLDGERCERWVLPDWYGTGGYLEIQGGAPRLVRFQD